MTSLVKKIGIGLGLVAKEVSNLSETQKAVAALKATPVGAQVAAVVQDLSSKDGLTGAQKAEAAVAHATPLIATLASNPGVFAVTVKEVEDIARALVQELFNELVSKTATGIAKRLLAVLGVK